jgi:hypothetical protein
MATSFLDLLETLDESSRKSIDAACHRLTLAAKEAVYHQGDPADAVYIVASGSVEVVTYSPDKKQSRTVATMTKGEFFGDLAVFTDHARLATVRAREASEVWKIGTTNFLLLMKAIPELGLFFSRILAHRLHRTSTEAHHHVYAIDLTGNLQKFDLLTIVQAITGMGHTGELRLNNSANELLGNFFFRNGRVEHARFGKLKGLEAIWQGFIESASEGTFAFRSTEQPTDPFEECDKIEMESTSLLLEGVGKRDTYQGLPKPLRDLHGSLHRLSDALDWKNDENKALAERIWALIAEPQPLIALREKLNVSASSFLDVVMEMGMNGQAELFVDESKIEE